MKLFQKAKEIRSREGALHFERYAIIETFLFAVYLHKIHKEDQDLHLHSHPWNFVTIVLKGSYRELGEHGESLKKVGTVSSMSRNRFHKIATVFDKPVTTLFLTFGKHKPWHYLVDGSKIESDEYRKLKHLSGFKT